MVSGEQFFVTKKRPTKTLALLLGRDKLYPRLLQTQVSWCFQHGCQLGRVFQAHPEVLSFAAGFGHTCAWGWIFWEENSFQSLVHVP